MSSCSSQDIDEIDEIDETAKNLSDTLILTGQEEKEQSIHSSINPSNVDMLQESIKNKAHFCYILFDNNNFTYNGYTNNLERRIRQHNRQIKGGARYTGKKQIETNDPCHWKYLLYITSKDPRFTNKKALSFEWSIKNPTNRRTRPNRSPLGRIKSLSLVFANKKFSDMKFQLFIHESRFASTIYNELKDIDNVEIIDTALF